MSFIDDSEKNVKKQLLKEEGGSGVGAVAGFVGRAGMEIDRIFAGGYHPDSGYGSKNLEMLEKQVEDRKEKRKELDLEDTEYGGESPLGGYLDAETKEAIDTYKILYADNDWRLKYNQDVTPVLDDRWKATDKALDIIFDDPGEAYSVRKLKFDKNPEYAGDNFINKSETNWKYINQGDK